MGDHWQDCLGTLYCTLVANATPKSGLSTVLWIDVPPRIADQSFAPRLCGRCWDIWLIRGWVCGSYNFDNDFSADALEMPVDLDSSRRDDNEERAMTKKASKKSRRASMKASKTNVKKPEVDDRKKTLNPDHQKSPHPI